MLVQDIKNLDVVVSELKHIQNNYLRVAVLASGGGSNFQALVERSKNSDAKFKIELLVCNRPGALVLERAKNSNIPSCLIDHQQFTKRHDFEKQLLEQMIAHKIDFIVCAGFMRVLTPFFLEHFSNRIINLHPSLLPLHKGLNAIQKTLDAKDLLCGCTVHVVSEGLDEGLILGQKSAAIEDGETLRDLESKVHLLEYELLPKVLDSIAKKVI